jgi:hypothetical protein
MADTALENPTSKFSRAAVQATDPTVAGPGRKNGARPDNREKSYKGSGRLTFGGSSRPLSLCELSCLRLVPCGPLENRQGAWRARREVLKKAPAIALGETAGVEGKVIRKSSMRTA